ncbi:MAG: hypothetical protein NXI21_19140 [Alphaproteobacteria bacterium]|nr:hypothetical protein [Alphaproteobacteria bacterium]
MVTSPSEESARAASAQLCIEFWKLTKAAAKAAEGLEESQARKLTSQIKFSERQLSVLAEELNLTVVAFDGEEFHAGLAASADNEDEFGAETALVVTKTLEPAIVSGMSVVRSGRVLVGPKIEAGE